MTIRAKTAYLPNWAAYLLLAIAPLCWAGNFVLARGVIEILPPFAFAFWRWILAFLLLLPFAWRYARRDWPAVQAGWRPILLLAVTGIAAFTSMVYVAMHTTTAINGALIQTTMPGFIIFMSVTIFSEKVSQRQLVGAGACIMGAATVVLHGDPTALFNLDLSLGDLIMTVAVVLYGIYSLALGHRPSIHPLSLMVYTFAIGALCLLPFYLWEMTRMGAFSVTCEVASSILFVALFPSIVAYFCWNRGIDIVGPSRGGLFICLMPVFASILAIVFLGEALRFFHIAGMLIILTGIFIFSR